MDTMHNLKQLDFSLITQNTGDKVLFRSILYNNLLHMTTIISVIISYNDRQK